MELAYTMKILNAKFPTCTKQVDYPVHKGKPNPAHGKFYFVGSIPGNCYDADYDNGPFSPKGKSKYYDSEQSAIDAALKGGASQIQRVNCSFVKMEAGK